MKRFNTRIPASIQKVRLDHFLAEWLPQVALKRVSRSTVRALILTGSVYVNRHRIKVATTPVYAGAVIEVYFDETRLFKNRPKRIEIERLETGRIVFEDEWLIVINKPSGLPTQPTLDPLRPNLFDLTRAFLRERDKAEEPYVGLHHRLDRDTSGLVLFTKKTEANKGVSELFSQHRIRKTYQCISWRAPGAENLDAGKSFEVESLIAKVGEQKGVARFGSVSKGGAPAITGFKVLESFRDACWFEARPKTGRTHQIRVHMSSIGFPILGDELYFPEKINFINLPPRLMLHALSLEFLHPVTGEGVRIECPLPREFVDYLGNLK
ncbi:MAG: RluA family pseudouridine synthase [Proteobacteria bacterium]|nr:RluA family pseudouridine synthase [Pseudomonadota bacterium]